MNKLKLSYKITTGLISLMTIAGATRYLFDRPFVEQAFTALGYPLFLITPMAVLKILGVIGILQNKSKFIKNLAYSGLFWNFNLAILSHIAMKDGEFAPALVCLILLVSSFYTKLRVDNN